MIGPICLCTALVLSAAPVIPSQKVDPLEAAMRYPSRVGAYIERQEAREERAAEAAAAARSESRTGEPGLAEPDVSLDWAALRECESGGNYRINTGNGYYGAYQFSLSTWASMGGSGLPSDASPAEQDARAQRLYNAAGASPWPTCGSLL